MKDPQAICILEEAETFMQTAGRASWQDYSYFKQRLINAGCYGYEKQLADILNL